jgi:hypothetical protein
MWYDDELEGYATVQDSAAMRAITANHLDLFDRIEA